jgi:hypothetical protein
MQLMSSGGCSTPGCGVGVSEVLFRAEQKLVDTMLVADLIYFATQNRDRLVVVSSDDDVWPGIHTAVIHGAKIHHVQTISGRMTPSHYSRLVSGTYLQHSM